MNTLLHVQTTERSLCSFPLKNAEAEVRTESEEGGSPSTCPERELCATPGQALSPRGQCGAWGEA